MTGWPTEKLGNLCKIQKGKTPSSFCHLKEGALPYLSARFMRSKGDAKFVSMDDKNVVMVDKKDLILICDGSNSGDIFTGFKGVLSSTMGRIDVRERIDSTYLLYFIKNHFNILNSSKKGAAIPHLDFNVFNNLQILLPPLSEQKKIINKITSLFSKIAQAKNLRIQTIKEADQFIAAEFSKIFFEGNRSSWEEREIGQIAQKIEYGTSQKAYDEGDVPVLRMNNIEQGLLNFDKLKYLPKDAKDLPKLYLKKDDILFNRTNSFELVGKTAIYEGEDDKNTFASYLIRVVVDQSKAMPRFVNYYLGSSLCRRTQIEPQITQEVGQANFSGGKLKKIKIPLPSLAEQKKIVSRLDSLSASIEKVKFLQNATRFEFVILEKAILEKAFSGKLVVEPLRKTVQRKSNEWFAIKQGVGAVLEVLAQTPFERGEMVIAKYMFFLQEIFNVQFGLHFARHNFGPYDPDIKVAIKASAFNKDKFFMIKGSGEQQVYGLGSNSAKLLKYSGHTLRDSRAALNHLIQHTRSAKSVDIERLATVCKIIQDIKNTDIDKIMSEMKQWKGGRFDEEQVKKTLDFIIAQGWDNVLISK